MAGTLALGPAPAAAAPCPNEQRRQESDVNPATGHPYSTELPECRSYEMVSPLFKQAHGAPTATDYGTPVAKNGETVGYSSEGDFADPENYKANDFHATNFFLAQRGESGWTTASAFAPRGLVGNPAQVGLDGDLSPDLRSHQVTCGSNVVVNGEGLTSSPVWSCAERSPQNECFAPLPIPADCWNATFFPSVYGTPVGGEQTSYLGASEDLSRVFIVPTSAFLPTTQGIQPPVPATVSEAGQTMYEEEGIGGPAPELRVVNVDNFGQELIGSEGEKQLPPLLGDYNSGNQTRTGTSYGAISRDGRIVFFAALANEPGFAEGPQTLFARVDHEHTVTISAPECEHEGCAVTPTSPPAEFQGASPDGSKVFFDSAQPLVEGDQDMTTDLYEYDFSRPEGKRLIQISAGVDNEHHKVGTGAEVLGVVRVSPDGSHIYFVARGVLTTEANANGGQAQPEADNLYGYDVAGETLKFVATIAPKERNDTLWGREDTQKRSAQVTPDGEYLVFSVIGRLTGAGDLNTEAAETVYRYHFGAKEEQGSLEWISRNPQCEAEAGPKGAEKTTPEKEECYEGANALMHGLERARGGAMASIDDWGRSISADGQYMIFTTHESLQPGRGGGLYLWHEGHVSWIGPYEQGELAAISATGSDIFFRDEVALVGQDTDQLSDLYDARVNGGFPAPIAPATCTGEACQAAASKLPEFGLTPSSLIPASGNLVPQAHPASPPAVASKPPTAAQLLAKALRACKRKPKKQRARCESLARKRYHK